MKLKPDLLVIFVIVSMLYNSNASANDDKIAFGQYLSGSCTTCHQSGETDGRIPNITGWEEESFVEVMKLFKNKELENTTMQTIASALSIEEIEALAAYFKSLAPEEKTIKDKGSRRKNNQRRIGLN